jgi:hypothetical protein
MPKKITTITTRPRGFAPWNPTAESRALIDRVKAILIEYGAYLPLTVRQIFYRLVGAFNYEKTEQAYERLGEKIARARRAGLIDFGAIRDDGNEWRTAFCWEGVADLVKSFVYSAEHFTLDRQEGQPARLVFAVEAAGMSPMVEEIAKPYGITVIPSGGFNSVTATHEMASRLGDFDAVEVLQIGDHDPSGTHIFSSLAEDVRAFAAGLGKTVPEFVRLAVTPRQIAAHHLPQAPPKKEDNRSFSGLTTQVESLPPDILAEIIQSAITGRLDRAAYDAVLAREEEAKAELRRVLLPALEKIGS